MSDSTRAAVETIRGRAGAQPVETAILVGAEMNASLDALEDSTEIPYSELAGFPQAASGPVGRLVVGNAEGSRIAYLCGRAHFHERGDAGAMAAPFAALAACGVRRIVLTCAAGSVNADVHPGTLVAVTDHINLSGISPLVGEPSERRFISMADAYDPRLLKRLKRASAAAGVPLREGIYMWFPAPSFETPAETRMAKALGADLIGNSLVPETVLARSLSLRVAALAIVTNFGAGFLGGAPIYAQTQQLAQQGSIGMKRLLRAFLRPEINIGG